MSEDSDFDRVGTVRGYLLQTLPDEVRERVESRLFAEEAFFDAVREAEDLLIDEYVLGELLAGDSTAFGRRIAESAELRERVDMRRGLVGGLRSLSGSLPRDLAGRTEAAVLNRGDGGRGRWTPALVVIAAGSLAACLMFGVMLGRSRGALREARGEIAALSLSGRGVGDAGAGSGAGAVGAGANSGAGAVIFLPSLVMRGAAAAPVFRVVDKGKKSGVVELQVQLPVGAEGVGPVQLTVRRQDEVLLQLNRLAVRTVGTVRYVSAYLPVETVVAGSYSVDLRWGAEGHLERVFVVGGA